MREKRKRIVDPETLAYYRGLFKKHLVSKILSDELVEYVINHNSK